jgi:hypothetical protein
MYEQLEEVFKVTDLSKEDPKLLSAIEQIHSYMQDKIKGEYLKSQTAQKVL